MGTVKRFRGLRKKIERDAFKNLRGGGFPPPLPPIGLMDIGFGFNCMFHRVSLNVCWYTGLLHSVDIKTSTGEPMARRAGPGGQKDGRDPAQPGLLGTSSPYTVQVRRVLGESLYEHLSQQGLLVQHIFLTSFTFCSLLGEIC